MTVDAGLALTGHPTEDSHDDVDLGLVREAQANPDAFGAIYFRYRDRVYGYLRARTETDEDAADLAQLVFTRAFDSLHQFCVRHGTLASWIFGIARHAAIDFHRRGRTAYIGDIAEIGGAGSIEAEVLRSERDHALRKAVETLPSEKQELLLLRYTAELTLPEIGRVVGKRPDAVRMSIIRTLQQLKELLHEID